MIAIAALILFSEAHAGWPARANASAKVCTAALAPTDPNSSYVRASSLLRFIAWDHPLLERTAGRVKRFADLVDLTNFANGWSFLDAEPGESRPGPRNRAFARAVRFEFSGVANPTLDPWRLGRAAVDRRSSANGKYQPLVRAMFRSLDQLWTELAKIDEGQPWNVRLRTPGEPTADFDRFVAFAWALTMTAEDKRDLHELRTALADPKARALAESVATDFYPLFSNRHMTMSNYLNIAICRWDARRDIQSSVRALRRFDASVLTVIQNRIFAAQRKDQNSPAARAVEPPDATQTPDVAIDVRQTAAAFVSETPLVTAETVDHVLARLHRAATLVNTILASLPTPKMSSTVAAGASDSVAETRRRLEAGALEFETRLGRLNDARTAVAHLKAWHGEIAASLADLGEAAPVAPAREYADKVAALLREASAAVDGRLEVERRGLARAGDSTMALGQHLIEGLRAPGERVNNADGPPPR